MLRSSVLAFKIISEFWMSNLQCLCWDISPLSRVLVAELFAITFRFLEESVCLQKGQYWHSCQTTTLDVCIICASCLIRSHRCWYWHQQSCISGMQYVHTDTTDKISPSIPNATFDSCVVNLYPLSFIPIFRLCTSQLNNTQMDRSR